MTAHQAMSDIALAPHEINTKAAVKQLAADLLRHAGCRTSEASQKRLERRAWSILLDQGAAGSPVRAPCCMLLPTIITSVAARDYVRERCTGACFRPCRGKSAQKQVGCQTGECLEAGSCNQLGTALLIRYHAGVLLPLIDGSQRNYDRLHAVAFFLAMQASIELRQQLRPAEANQLEQLLSEWHRCEDPNELFFYHHAHTAYSTSFHLWQVLCG